MRSKLSRSLLPGAVAALLAAGIFLALSDRKRAPQQTATPPTPTAEPEFPRFIPPPPPTTEEMRTAAVFTPEFPAADGGLALLPPLPLQSGELPWEKQVRGVLERKDLSDTAKSQMLLEMVQSLPVEGRETATEEAVKRLPNTDYRVARPVIVNPGTYGLALSILFADLMQRPVQIKLPTLLEIARIPQHPYAGPARENLQLLLGADFGADWNRWDAAVRAAVTSGKR